MTAAKAKAAFMALGTTPAEIRACLNARDPDTARARLSALHARIKPRFRSLCRELHPDVTGGDPAKEEALRDIIEVWREIESAEILDAETMGIAGVSPVNTTTIRVTFDPISVVDDDGNEWLL